jgi:redox-sensitive bicupin YhaK (pirin superfamily)
MIQFRDRNARGRHRGAMVDAYHTFSFADFHDPRHMGFRDLRVLNEDIVMPGVGFPEHSHQDIEIVTIVLKGTIAHRDNLGNERWIRAGEVQRMSAGTGILHSELNPSGDERAHALQIWIIPQAPGGVPSYEQRAFPREERRNRWVRIASADGSEHSLALRQDAQMELARLDWHAALERPLSPARGYWVQVLSGVIGLNGTEMREGDGAAMTGEEMLTIEAETQAEVLLIDLP